jgi:hypothetical protein
MFPLGTADPIRAGKKRWPRSAYERDLGEGAVERPNVWQRAVLDPALSRPQSRCDHTYCSPNQVNEQMVIRFTGSLSHLLHRPSRVGIESAIHFHVRRLVYAPASLISRKPRQRSTNAVPEGFGKAFACIEHLCYHVGNGSSQK